MAYADLIDDEGVNAQFLAILKPRRRVTGFSVYSGAVYSVSFDYGEVVAVTDDGASLAQGSSPSLSAGQFYHDVSASVLYVRRSGGGNPNAVFTVATYELYVGTFDAHHHRVPTDASTRAVYFEPVIKRSPALRATSSDFIFGLMPVGTQSLVLSNATHLFEKHVYDSSFNQAEVVVYHWLGKLSAANLKEVFRGIASAVSYSDEQITVRLYDRVDTLKSEFRHVGTGVKSFFATSDFPALDPKFHGRPIRGVWGVVGGFVPVNVDQVVQSPTTSDNRDWVVLSGQSNLGSVTTTVPASPASTATRSYLTSAVGFRVGDSVWLDRAVGTDEYRLITAVGANYIEHSALAGGAMASGDSVKRSFIGSVTVTQNNAKYIALYSRDYTENTGFAAGAAGFSFTTTMEANLGIPSTLSTNDRVHCRVYGHKNAVTLGGPAFGGNDSETGNLTHPIVILFQLLKTYLGIPESGIATAGFVSLQASHSRAIGFAVPAKSTENFPQFKNLIGSILASELLKLFLDSDAKWAAHSLGPLGTVTKTLDDTELAPRGQFGYEFDWSDTLSDVIVEYAAREIAEDVSDATSGESEQVIATSNLAKYVHGVNRQQTFQSRHFKAADAQKLADRLGFLLGDRAGHVSLATKGRFFDTVLSHVIQVSRSRMPGFEFDAELERARKFAVAEVTRTLAGVRLTLEDQKGVEDNAGSW